MVNSMSERCPVGILGFDELCSGGFVRNSVNAIIGGPGTGKTIFLMQFLYNGVDMFDENGLFVSFEPDITELYKDSQALGFGLEKLEAEGKILFTRFSPKTEVSELKIELTKLISKYKIKRICLDPVTFLGANIEDDGKARLLIFELVSLLKRLGATVLLAVESDGIDAESGITATSTKEQYVKFMADGLVNLYSSGLGGVSDRAIRISKMRRTSHTRGPVPMQITDKGMKIKNR